MEMIEYCNADTCFMRAMVLKARINYHVYAYSMGIIPQFPGFTFYYHGLT